MAKTNFIRNGLIALVASMLAVIVSMNSYSFGLGFIAPVLGIGVALLMLNGINYKNKFLARLVTTSAVFYVLPMILPGTFNPLAFSLADMPLDYFNTSAFLMLVSMFVGITATDYFDLEKMLKL